MRADGRINPSFFRDFLAMNRLIAYKTFHDLDISVSFVELQNVDYVCLLCKFFEQTCNVNDKLYPFSSLMEMYYAFDRVMRQWQNKTHGNKKS